MAWTHQQTQTVALRIIASHGVSPAGPNLYRVESQSNPGRAYVVTYGGVWMCECAFHVAEKVECCHIAASKLFRRTGDPDLGVAPMTYPQAWSAYNAAQVAEIGLFDSLLADLASTVTEPHADGMNGRPPLPMRDQVFVAVQKVYSQLSSRRAASLFGNATERGQLDHAPHYNSVSKFLLRPEATSILRRLIQQSALPLAGIEQDFAVDSTGFTTNGFGSYLGEKHGAKRHHTWLKAHLCVGVATHIVTDAIVTPNEGEGTGDSPNFAPLVQATARGFQIDEVSADKAYSSKDNHAIVHSLGGQALIPFKSIVQHDSAAKGPAPPSLWRKAHAYFVLHQEEFYARYHKRSNVETVNSAIKRKFGESLKSKNQTAQTNELLCKILAYNLTVLIHEMHESGLPLNLAACTQTSPILGV